MRILENLSIKEYRKTQDAQLADLGDLNIIIGPNNCGKSSILKAITCLTRIDITIEIPNQNMKDHRALEVHNKAFNTNHDFMSKGLSLKLEENELFNNKGHPDITYSFNPSALEYYFQEIFGKNFDYIIRTVAGSLHPERKPMIFDESEIKQGYNDYQKLGFFDLHLKTSARLQMKNNNFSFLSIEAMMGHIKKRIVFCDDARLDSYNKMRIDEYLSKKDFDTGKLQDVMNSLKMVYTDIHSYKTTSKKVVEASKYESYIDDQGSGIRSMICLMADLMSAPNNSILLIDEPELGLNPASKQDFLAFIHNQAKENQVFITTHDPTFINPTIIKLLAEVNRGIKTSIFLYSSIKNKFVKVPMDISKEVAGSFAGYLPHTTSYKELHVYVEGRIDAQNFKEFFYKILWSAKQWNEIEDRIGIYYLHGDFWQHILSTIPSWPYQCIVILDGDKRKKLQENCEPYNEPLKDVLEKSQRVIFFDINDLKPTTDSSDRPGKQDELKRYMKTGKKILVFILSKDKIEDYIIPVPKTKNDGTEKIHDMKLENIDAELKTIINFICKSLTLDAGTPNAEPTD